MQFSKIFSWLKRNMLAKKRMSDYRKYLDAKRKKEQYVSYEKAFQEYTVAEHIFWLFNIPPKTQVITLTNYRKLLLKRYKGLRSSC